MAFDGLGDKLQDIFKRMKGQGKISEKDLKAVMREVKMAAPQQSHREKGRTDSTNQTHFSAFLSAVRYIDHTESPSLYVAVVKIVHDELTELLGGVQSKLLISPKPPTVIMMVGLQGSGKTTTTGKLGRLLKKQGKRPLDNAAPPRVSPSSLVRTTPLISKSSLKLAATLAASCPTMESTTSKISVGCTASLQGSGKTTTTGKLGRLLKKQGKRPLLAACDIYRPAAIKQLQVLGEQLPPAKFPWAALLL